jgi:hypothetical protein
VKALTPAEFYALSLAEGDDTFPFPGALVDAMRRLHRKGLVSCTDLGSVIRWKPTDRGWIALRVHRVCIASGLAVAS